MGGYGWGAWGDLPLRGVLAAGSLEPGVPLGHFTDQWRRFPGHRDRLCLVCRPSGSLALPETAGDCRIFRRIYHLFCLLPGNLSVITAGRAHISGAVRSCKRYTMRPGGGSGHLDGASVLVLPALRETPTFHSCGVVMAPAKHAS